MEAVVTQVGAVEAPFGDTTTYYTPPVAPSEFDFERWLVERTPIGAPTVAIRAPGARSQFELPQIRSAVASPTSWLGRRRRGSAPAVHAAYLVDVGGMSPRQLVRSGFFEFTTDRGARHHVRDGRLTAADLGAWPWAVADGKPLQRNWWADRHFALALQDWATGELQPLAVRARLPVA